jgi:hypothetical protein
MMTLHAPIDIAAGRKGSDVQHFFHPRAIRLAHQSGIHQLPHALARFLCQYMTGMTMSAKYLACAGNLESLCCTLRCFPLCLHKKLLPKNELPSGSPNAYRAFVHPAINQDKSNKPEAPIHSQAGLLALLGNKDGYQCIPLHFGGTFNIGKLLKLLNQTIHKLSADLLVRHFSAPKNNRCLGLIPFINESDNVVLLKLKVVFFGFGPEFDFLQNHLLLVLLCLVGSFALLVLEFAIIHDPANWGIGARCNLD